MSLSAVCRSGDRLNSPRCRPPQNNMQTRIRLPEPDNWLEAIPLPIVIACAANGIALGKAIKWYVNHAAQFDARFSTYECLRELGLEMPRGKKTNGTANNNGSNNSGGTRGDVKWVWGNCKLSNEDIATLERDTSTIEYLVTCLASLGNDGYGFTCKPVDKGKSHCCTIFRPDYPSDGTTVGVSAFGGDIRDAILTCLYKLDTYGGGDFTGFDLESGDSGARPRFR